MVFFLLPGWDNIIKSKKNVRSKDNFSIGNVVADSNDKIFVIDDINSHTYKIPKSNVESYNGSEVFLNITNKDLKRLDTDLTKSGQSKENYSKGDLFTDLFIKGLDCMDGTIKIAFQNEDSIRIESVDNEIKLDIIDPSIFEISVDVIKDSKTSVKNNITDFFKYIQEAREFTHKLSENNLTISILYKGKNIFTLGKDANPTLSKLLTRSDDIQINSIRKSIKLATEISKEEEKEK